MSHQFISDNSVLKRFLIPVLFFACIGVSFQSVKSAERPNVVLLMADDQGWGDVGYYGHPQLQTPVLNEMAANGLRFDEFYAAAPVCSPTRASVLTGRHPNRSGVFSWGHSLRPQEVTIAELLKDAGYRTGHFGKWHLGSVRPESPVNPGNQGFDEWWSSPNFYENNPILSHNGTATKTEGESSMVTVEKAIAFMKSAVDAEAPFLAVIWFGNPHTPHEALPELQELYPNMSKAEQNYYGELTGIDRSIGHLRETLDELEVRGETMLWYTSDNGGQGKVSNVGDLRGKKGQLYEGGLKVPTIIEWPERIPESRVTNFRANTNDILPTVLDLLGRKMPDDRPLDGVSLVGVIDGKTETRDQGMGFWVYPERGIRTPSAEWMLQQWNEEQGKADPTPLPALTETALLKKAYSPSKRPGHAAWTEGDWKLHRIPGNDETFRTELYNLTSDPNEKNNVAKSHPDQTDRLSKALEKWQLSVIDSLNGQDY